MNDETSRARVITSNDSDASEEHTRHRKPNERPIPAKLDILDLVSSESGDRSAESPPKKRKRLVKKARAPSPKVSKKAKSKAKGSPKKPKKAQAPRKTINDWPGLEEVARVAGIHSVTTVDPGTVNCAVMRMEFPSMRITHARVLDLRRLCELLEEQSPTIKLNSATAGAREDYSLQAKLYALGEYVKRECKDGGIFDSDSCLVEEQSFDRAMARVESTIVGTFNLFKPPIVVIEGMAGGTWTAARTVTARCVKTCYRPLFPLTIAPRPPRGRSNGRGGGRAFGMGDVHHSGQQEAQRRAHKKAAIKYGSYICPQSRFERVVPPENFTEDDRKRLSARKMDDLYDTLFMCLYFASTLLFQAYKCRKRGYSRAMPAFEVPSQRPRSNYEEVIHACAALGSEPDCVQLLINALMGESIVGGAALRTAVH